jgi:hypothetical protein
MTATAENPEVLKLHALLRKLVAERRIHPDVSDAILTSLYVRALEGQER